MCYSLHDMKFSVHKFPPSRYSILDEKKRSTNTRLIMSLLPFIAADFYLIDSIRIDKLLLGTVVVWAVMAALLYISNLLQPRSLRFVQESVNQELLTMSMRHEAILNYVSAITDRPLVYGELTELRRYNERVAADSESTGERCTSADEAGEVLEHFKSSIEEKAE